MAEVPFSLAPKSSSRSLSAEELAAVRRSRRDPRRTQFDYLHLDRLVGDFAAALARVEPQPSDVLDVWCGSRPYDDLLPARARVVGLDVPGNPYGVADVTSNVILPFGDESFDLIVCVEAFQFIHDPRHAVHEFRRVLRRGGTAIIAVPYAFEYDRRNFERRYTGNELTELFEGWNDVALSENGGRAVAWTVLTGSIVAHALARRGSVARALTGATCLALNALGGAVDRLETHLAHGETVYPMNLMVAARKPND
jgi:SAM-dependent methyltransferase